jgi:cytochrome b561
MMSSPAAASPVAYDRRTIYLHWMSAILVLLLWGVAQVIDLFPRGAPRIAARSVHIVLGVVLAVVVVRRLLWRALSGRRLPPPYDGYRGQAVRLSHALLYATLVAVIVLGIANAWARGDSIFGLFSVPKLLPEHPMLKPAVGRLHKTGANALMILALMHGLAALVHHYILRDALLQRMRIRRVTR